MKTNKQDFQWLRRRMEADFVCYGQYPPTGMVEEYEKETGKKFVPRKVALLMFHILTSKKYEL